MGRRARAIGARRGRGCPLTDMRPSERLTLSFLVGLSALAVPGLPGSATSLAVFVALAAATLLLARNGAGPPRLVRDFFPVALVIAVYLALEPVIVGGNSGRWDAIFAAVDERWAGGLVAAWHGAFGRRALAVDAVYVSYLSYYLVPIVAVVLARREGPEAFERGVFTLLLCYYASFIGYLLFPTSGPRLPPQDEARLLGGGAISDLVRAFLQYAEKTRLDAFPSGHTAISLVAWAVGVRASRRAALPLGAWVAAVVFSTVYVHVHYVVDVAAGAVLAGIVLVAADALLRALSPRERPEEAL
jgi:membrane-associated phospholipid phosphatase